MHTLVSYDPPIAVDRLSKAWPQRGGFFRRRPKNDKVVLHEVTLQVHRATCTVVLGENGAGKTTLLKVIGGLAGFQSGSVSLYGSSRPEDLRHARLEKVAYSGGERGFYHRLTVNENLQFFGRLEGLRFATLRARIAAVLEILALQQQRDVQFSNLSAGLRQRVAVARVLLKTPDILLLDEPTRLLDPMYASELRRFIREELIQKGEKTVVVATNLIDEAVALGDAFALIRDGRLHTIEGDCGHEGIARALQATDEEKNIIKL
jgi:ABC-2 type transport system ATP-binding protein